MWWVEVLATSWVEVLLTSSLAALLYLLARGSRRSRRVSPGLHLPCLYSVCVSKYV